MPIQSLNPATGQVIRDYREMTPDEVTGIIEKTYAAYLEWRKSDFSVRRGPMQKAAQVLRAKKEEYAALITSEMGKAVREARIEVEKCAVGCEHYARAAEKYLADEIIGTDASKSYVAFRPMGVVLAVMPWNFPFWQVFRFLAPALMAGNAGLLKHASNVPGCALAIEQIVREAGFPPDLFRTLMIGSRQVDRVIEHPSVVAVTLTGSTPAGKAVARKAGEVLKKSVLELGGSDPYIVLEDADLEAAASICAAGRLQNCGQSCIAAKRFIVIESVRERFEALLVKARQEKKTGDPMDEKTDMGPMARTDLREELHDQVRRSVDKGAKVLLGGEIPAGLGAYYPATVLAQVKKGSPAFDEEMFGPVAAVISARDEAEAVALANDTVFGLGGGVLTRDSARGERIARDDLEAGNCFVNAFVKSDPRLPFGGVKESGYGRELSHYGIKEFVNIKTVYVK
jgi:succinate-semialdehyde dehydrogenase/glutarate-semialdehyde dehydrogenase